MDREAATNDHTSHAHIQVQSEIMIAVDHN